MDEAVIKDEVIEETCNFTFKNGEYVEVKQEGIEQKPANLLERDIKTETNGDFFDKSTLDGFLEDVKTEPEENDSKIKMSKESIYQCKICQMRMPRKLLRLVKSEKDKTVLSEIFKVGGFTEANPTHVCYSHIQTIIDDNDDKTKSPSTAFEQRLRSFVTRNKNLMKERKLRRRICQVCHMNKPYSQLYQIGSKDIRMVIMIGCILRGTHSVEQAKDYTENNRKFTCYSHCKQSIDMIFVHLGVRNTREFWNCPIRTMGCLMDIVKSIDSNFTAEEIVSALNSLFDKIPTFERFS
ncbi:hypothetical protein B9Z55_021060 [Caenorhabditis nigoni]|uniref:Lin-15A/B-like domain-containing protein n=1 Tax=Caenorhabditis nigoni TaxID=1611254 RepID=A0A2G5TQF5_9PELO|nr:hypothetical protein B9Z55_021060 [Caenorhabditis nigoni]